MGKRQHFDPTPNEEKPKRKVSIRNREFKRERAREKERKRERTNERERERERRSPPEREKGGELRALGERVQTQVDSICCSRDVFRGVAAVDARPRSLLSCKVPLSTSRAPNYYLNRPASSPKGEFKIQTHQHTYAEQLARALAQGSSVLLVGQLGRHRCSGRLVTSRST